MEENSEVKKKNGRKFRIENWHFFQYRKKKYTVKKKKKYIHNMKLDGVTLPTQTNTEIMKLLLYPKIL